MKKERTTKVLYLTYDGLTDHIGQSQILPYILACSKKGIRFHILSFEKRGKEEKIAQLQKILDQNGIVWHRLNFTQGRNIVFKIYDFLRFVGKAFGVAFRNSYSIIHSRSYFASSIALLLKIFLGPKLIFDKRDFWIDAQVETGRLQLTRFSDRIVHRMLRSFERRLFLTADHIVSLTETAKTIVLDKYPSRKLQDISVIPCCVDLSLFDPKTVSGEEVEWKRNALRLNGSMVLGYIGSIGPTYMVPDLLDCFKTLKAEGQDLRLLFLVNNDKEDVYRIVESKGLSREEVIVTSASRDLMPLYISLFDVGIFFITPTYAKKASSPTKLSEMLAMNKPVITNTGVGDVERIFGELECGYLIPEFNQEEYARAAQWLKHFKKKETAFNLEKYSLEYGAEKYFEIYRRLSVK